MTNQCAIVYNLSHFFLTIHWVSVWLWWVMLLWMFLKYLLEYQFSILIYIPRSRIAESCGNFVFNFLRNHQTLFQSSYCILHLPQQCTRVSISPEPLQYLFSAFLEYGYPRGCEVVSPCDFHWQFPPPSPRHPTSLFLNAEESFGLPGSFDSSDLPWWLRS